MPSNTSGITDLSQLPSHFNNPEIPTSMFFSVVVIVTANLVSCAFSDC